MFPFEGYLDDHVGDVETIFIVSLRFSLNSCSQDEGRSLNNFDVISFDFFVPHSYI